MFRKSVTSSVIASVGYDEANRILEVEFRSGSIYQYLSVPPDRYVGLMAAESHGEYFNEHIKKAGFVCRRIR